MNFSQFSFVKEGILLNKIYIHYDTQFCKINVKENYNAGSGIVDM